MTAPHRDSFSDSVAAYTLGALDALESREFEAHLATCDACRHQLAELQRVTVGLGTAVAAVAPPESLKARTLARATVPQQPGVTPQVSKSTAGSSRPGRVSYGWLAMAASVAFVAAGLYGWSLRSQLQDLTQTVTELSNRANVLRNSLDDARRESARLSHVVDVVEGPGTILVSLNGTAAAPGAAGRAYFNAARGLVLSTDRMPALRPGRAYQLWLVGATPKPLSAGVFTVSPAGAATFAATLPAALTIPVGAALTVAVTEEPAGGSGGPTTAILLAGGLKGR